MRRWIEELGRAWRSLTGSPMVSVLSIMTLALGIGATAAIFTVLNGVVLKPLAFPDAERLVRLRSAVPGYEDGAVWNLSNAQYFHFREHAGTLDALGVWQVNSANVRTPDRTARAVIGIASEPMFGLVGARALHGRLPGPADDAPGSAPVAVLSHDYWQRAFAADASVVGETLELDGQSYEVIGVMAPGVRLPGESGAPRLMERPEIWTTQRLDPAGPYYNSHVFMAIGRLADGVDLGQARAEIETLSAQLSEAYPSVYEAEFMQRFGFRTEAVPLQDVQVGDMARHLWLLFSVVVLVLLAALANVVNLFLARVEARHHEFVMRAALGANLRALGRHLLVQSMILTGIGALFAVVVAFLGVRALLVYAPETLPRVDDIGIDATVVAFVAALAVFIALVLTLLVLWRLRGEVAAPAAGSGGHRATAGAERRRVRAGLVAGQVAIALALLVAAGMLLQGFARLGNIDPGFEPDRVARVQLHLPGERYTDHAAVWQFYRELFERVGALPGIESVGAGNPLPLSGEYGCWAQGFEDAAVEQRMRERGGTSCGDMVVTAPGYFETLGVPVLAGRALTPADLDHPEAGAVVVSETFAERFWPGEDALGKGVRPLAAPGETPRYYRVVGVVGDLPAATLEGAAAAAVYYPIIPVPGEGFPVTPSRHLHLLIRTGEQAFPDLAATIRRQVRSQDPAVAVGAMGSMRQMVEGSMSRVAFSMRLLTIAALTALFLSAVGLYGVISYLVARRTREMGVRIALGAARERVRRLVMAGSLKLVGIGLVVGSLAALAIGRVLHGMFYGIRPADPLVFVTAAAVLLGVAALASYFPARHAARTKPIEALRQD